MIHIFNLIHSKLCAQLLYWMKYMFHVNRQLRKKLLEIIQVLIRNQTQFIFWFLVISLWLCYKRMVKIESKDLFSWFEKL